MALKSADDYNKDFAVLDLMHLLVHMRNVTVPRENEEGFKTNKDDLVRWAMVWDRNHPDEANDAYDAAIIECRAIKAEKEAEKVKRVAEAAKAAKDATDAKVAKAAKASKAARPTKAAKAAKSTKTAKTALAKEGAQENEMELGNDNDDAAAEQEPPEKPLPSWLKRAIKKKHTEWSNAIDIEDLELADEVNEEWQGMAAWACTINDAEYKKFAYGRNGFVLGR